MTSVCTLEEMLRKFAVSRNENGSYTAPALSGGRGVVDASQIVAQSIVAATSECPEKRVASISMVFAKTMSEESDVQLVLSPINVGRSFASLSVDAMQNGKCCARGILLLDSNEEDFISSQIEMPATPDPESCMSLEMNVAGRDVRLTENVDLMSASQQGPAKLDVWVRYQQGSEDYAVNQGLVAHLSNHFSIAAALRPHEGLGLAGAHRDFSGGVLSLAVTFHAELNVSDWLLYSHNCTFAGRGMSFCKADVFTRTGRLIASFTQENMIRGMPQRAAAKSGSQVL